MSKKQPQKPETQADRFLATARALECDEDKERFEAKLKRIAAAKAVPPQKSDKGKGTK
jgi:hypothetical protein